jgi:predicted MPP superfamily phosphohydrolase
MKRVAWLTDIHLDFLTPDVRIDFIKGLALHDADALVISGDIGEAHCVEQYLTEIAEYSQIPVYFVLGNHDFYGASIERTRARVSRLAELSNRLTYLSAAGVVGFTPSTCVIGHDGWADARLGSYEASKVMLNDYIFIEELADLDRATRRNKLESLGDEAAEYLGGVLLSATERFQRILLVTHVPPFREAGWYRGRIQDDDWMPHFTCKAAGDRICDVMRSRPERHLTVVCGHTHGEGYARVLGNVEVFTGGASYGQPGVQRVFEFD